jgi:hypothetical protein
MDDVEKRKEIKENVGEKLGVDEIKTNLKEMGYGSMGRFQLAGVKGQCRLL